MKRFLACLCAVVMAVCMLSAAAAETESKQFDTTLTSVIGKEATASSILSSGLSRALLTVTLMLDLGTGPEPQLKDNGATVLINKSYVGKKEDVLTVLMYDDDLLYSIVYSPDMPEVGFYFTQARNGLTDDQIELISRMANDETYPNSLTDLNTVVQGLSEAMGGN